MWESTLYHVLYLEQKISFQTCTYYPTMILYHVYFLILVVIIIIVANVLLAR